MGRATAFDYDAVGGSAKVTDPSGRVELFTYDGGLLRAHAAGWGRPVHREPAWGDRGLRL